MSYLKSELSVKNKWWIPKHRYYELKHYCLQYPDWKRLYSSLEFKMEGAHITPGASKLSDPVGNLAGKRADIRREIELVERVCKDAGPGIEKYLLLAVTEGTPFVKLAAQYDTPCGKDYFYDCYRKFFWLLSRERGF